ncbi:MAG: UvrD-helicase domain-containing protein [Desulfobacterales bacterium]|nr:UvrD-helicase domain-containing protein [Desulfobacterales bacterium]
MRSKFKELELLTVPMEGKNLIEASAGTGKTFTISNLYLRLILEKNLNVQNILVVTYTEAATKELKDRIRKNLYIAYSSIDDLDKCEDVIIKDILSNNINYNGNSAKNVLRRAIIDFDEAAIFTIHGFCRRILLEHCFESNILFDTELISNQQKIIEEITYDFWRQHIIADDAAKDNNILEELDIKKLIKLSELVVNKPFLQIRKEEDNDFILNLKLKYILYLREQLSINKAIKNVQSFDDLINNFWKSLNSNVGDKFANSIQKQFKAALIDEFQDTDPIQYNIFNKIFDTDEHIFFMIGDPKQSIYGFRNADVFAYMEAELKIPNDKKYSLYQNWRSETKLLSSVNKLFSHSNNPFILEGISYQSVNDVMDSKGNKNPLIIDGEEGKNLFLWVMEKNNGDKKDRKAYLSLDIARNEAINAVSYEILRILELSKIGQAKIGDRPIRLSDFAILVLKHEVAKQMQKRLSELNIPSVLKKSGNIFDTKEAQEIKRFLMAVASPSNVSLLNGALISSMIGLNSDDIIGFVENDSCLEEYETHITNFTNYTEIWSSKGFIRMFRKFLSDYKVRQNLLKFPDGERLLTNIIHLSEIIHKSSIENKFGINQTLSWLKEQIDSEDKTEEREIKLERDDEALQIITVFSSKGLEYPIVFCPFMWEKTSKIKEDDFVFHEDNRAYINLSRKKEDNDPYRCLSEKEELAELMRLLYVAVTRAKNRCYIVCGQIGQKIANSLEYLFAGDLESITKFSKADFYKKVAAYIKGEDAIHLSVISNNDFTDLEKYKPPVDYEKISLVSKDFSRGHIHQNWGIASYSYLTSGEKHKTFEQEKPIRRDEPFYEQIDIPEEVVVQPQGFFAFPKGAIPGTCIHEVFENIDFTSTDKESLSSTVQSVLESYGLDKVLLEDIKEDSWTNIVNNMVEKVLSALLLPYTSDLALNKISLDNRISEMEFFYPINKIYASNLKNVFKQFYENQESFDENFPDTIGNLRFNPVEGFMHGFIDLVFCYEDKYYIIDWKTNHLGNDYANYAVDKIKISIHENLYNLQYHIYSVALHKYLESRIDDYEYKRYFGGVFYLYVRGITPDIPGIGVFYDLPDEELILNLCELFGEN